VLGRITKHGNVYLRTLLSHGARAVLQSTAKRTDTKSQRGEALRQRRGETMAAVALNQTTEDSYTPSPTVGHFPARPEPFDFAQDKLRGAKSKGVASSLPHASTSPCGLRSA
jgi:hypothetical protein